MPNFVPDLRLFSLKPPLMRHLHTLLILLLLCLCACRQAKNVSPTNIGERCSTADSLMNKGDYQNAMKAYIDVLEMASDAGTDSLVSYSLKQIGTIYAFHDDNQKALSYYEKSMHHAREANDTAAMTNVLPNLILMNRDAGNRDKEQQYLRLFQSFPNPRNPEVAYYQLYIPFVIYIEAGDDARARELFVSMLRFIDEHNLNDDSAALLYNHLGMRYAEKQNFDSALSCYHTALRLLDIHPQPNSRQAVYTNLCELFKKTGDADSLAFYREKIMEADATTFNMRNFSKTKEELDAYEKEMNDRRIERMKTHTYYIIAGAVTTVLLLLIVGAFLLRAKKKRRLTEPAYDIAAPEQASPSVACAAEGTPDSSSSDSRLSLSDELRRRLADEILQIMNDNETVFNSDFNVNMLALRLNTNTRYVTEVIHDLGGSNFRNFINEYRIREACRRLRDKDRYGHLTIAAIATDVGFNSHNSFISAFRKVTGMTPAQYRSADPETDNPEESENGKQEPPK